MNHHLLSRSGGILLLLAVLLTACGSPAPASAPSPTPRDDTLIWAALVEGVHGDTYSFETGPNTYCARCKSPVNWDPAAFINLPPNCVTCKFDSDTALRVAEGNPLVQEHEWEGIRCYNCHPDDEAGEIDAAIAWWDAQTDTHVPQETSTALCEQCHRDTEYGVTRQIEQADSVAHADATCTTCHDPHSGAASCEDCHNADDSETDFIANCWQPYLAPDADAPHPDLLCVTCHDHGGLEARPVDDSSEPFFGQWATWRATLIAGVIPSNHVWVSHNLAAEVACDRCHYAGNPWELEVEVNES